MTAGLLANIRLALLKTEVGSAEWLAAFAAVKDLVGGLQRALGEVRAEGEFPEQARQLEDAEVSCRELIEAMEGLLADAGREGC